MNLIKEIWTLKDKEEFQKYLKSFENKDKIEWTKNILNTKMPVLAIKTPFLKEIAKEISKGNYLSFLDLMIWEYYENTPINGVLISKINDFITMKKYLDIYCTKADNWATIDTVSFNIKNKEKEFLYLVNEYIKSKNTFTRRMGINILFNFTNNKKYTKKIFKILDMFEKEEEYYVNMINAWLLCEMMIKHRKETIEYLENNKLNKFTINKGIQKCRDSYRVTKEDKDMLLKYKK